MGFAISCGIAIAAFVMAMFLTPAVTALLGARAWWPGTSPGPSPHPASPAPARQAADGHPRPVNSHSVNDRPAARRARTPRT